MSTPRFVGMDDGEHANATGNLDGRAMCRASQQGQTLADRMEGLLSGARGQGSILVSRRWGRWARVALLCRVRLQVNRPGARGQGRLSEWLPGQERCLHRALRTRAVSLVLGLPQRGWRIHHAGLPLGAAGGQEDNPPHHQDRRWLEMGTSPESAAALSTRPLDQRAQFAGDYRGRGEDGGGRTEALSLSLGNDLARWRRLDWADGFDAAQRARGDFGARLRYRGPRGDGLDAAAFEGRGEVRTHCGRSDARGRSSRRLGSGG